MVCLLCGHCCHYLLVMIVDDPKLGIVEGNIIAHIDNGKPCKHLKGNRPGDYSCAIHDEPWYEQTPCYAYGQIESSPDKVCRIGEAILNGETK